MALRTIEIIIPSGEKERVKEIIDSEIIITSWIDRVSDNNTVVRLLLQSENTEQILDELEQVFLSAENFRAIMLPVEATLPRVKEKNDAKDKKENSVKNSKPPPLRISREELYTQISDGAKITNVFIAMVILSSIVAAIGLVKDSVAVVIGAMVIAPLLGPNVALALATTLGDFELGKRALKSNLAGVSIALAIAMLLGLILNVELSSGELSLRTNVGLSDIALAIASGAAGALAFTSGVSATLIGVMVAVALLPPLMGFGLLLGSGFYEESLGAFLLLITNLICINLAGVITFLIQGIRPRRWWEAKKAGIASRYAILIWSALLILLIGTIILSQETIF